MASLKTHIPAYLPAMGMSLFLTEGGCGEESEWKSHDTLVNNGE